MASVAGNIMGRRDNWYGVHDYLATGSRMQSDPGSAGIGILSRLRISPVVLVCAMGGAKAI